MELRTNQTDRHGWLQSYLPDDGKRTGLLHGLFGLGWVYKRCPGLYVYALWIPDPEVDEDAVTRFVDRRTLQRLLSLDFKGNGWAEIFPSLQEAQSRRAVDGRAFVNRGGGYLIVDLTTRQVSYRSEAIERWFSTGHFPRFSR